MIELDRYLREEMPTRYELEDRKSLNGLEMELNNMSLVCEPRERPSQLSVSSTSERRQSIAMATPASVAGIQVLEGAAPRLEGGELAPLKRQRRPTNDFVKPTIIGHANKGAAALEQETGGSRESKTLVTSRIEPRGDTANGLSAIEEEADADDGQQVSERRPDALQDATKRARPPSDDMPEGTKTKPPRDSDDRSTSDEEDAAALAEEESLSSSVPQPQVAQDCQEAESPTQQPKLRPQPMSRTRQTSVRMRRQRDTRFESAV
jgi:hypothetical protein